MSESRPLVLVVDDERSLADLYAAWLGEQYDVRVAHGGDEAIEAFDDDVDAALLDRRMPRTSGDEVLSAVRDRGVDAPVAMVTAVDPDFGLLSVPLDAYLVKPVSQDQLLRTIETLLDHRGRDPRTIELASLHARRAAINATQSEPVCADSEAYDRLLDRIERVEAALDSTTVARVRAEAADLYQTAGQGLLGGNE